MSVATYRRLTKGLANRLANRLVRGLVATAACLGALTLCIPSAHAEVEAFARVVVERCEVRSGPSISARVIAVLDRNASLTIDRRSSDAFWLKIVLEDGRTGFIVGDEVEVFADRGDERKGRPGFFAPPPLVSANAGFSLFGGALGSRAVLRDNPSESTYAISDGYFEIRPAWVIAPPISFEPFAGISRGSDGTTTMAGALAVLHLLPDLAVDPYLALGGGHLWTTSSADSLAVKDDTMFVARAGGGLLFGLRSRILVRIEATNLTLFTPNRFRNVQAYVAGLGVYF